jgi:hypothetical protein
MKFLLASLLLVVSGTVLFASGCTVGASSGPVEVVCTADDGACGSDVDCCSYLCASDGFCGLPVGCSEDNVACGADSDCCSDICASDGYCGIP